MSDSDWWSPTQAELQEMVEVLFELSHDLVCVAGADGRYIRVNAEWTASMGYAPNEVAGKLWLDFVHPEDRERTLAAAQNMSSRKLVDFENRCRHKDGTYRHLAWRASTWSAGRAFATARVLDRADTALAGGSR